MPNWCSNKLIVTGNVEQLKDFKSKSLVKANHTSINDFDFTFEVLFPTPTELLETTSPNVWNGDENDIEGKKLYNQRIQELQEKYGFSDWYSWRVTKWGTKWDCNESYVETDEDETFIVTYDTAWAPNTNWVNHVSEIYPDLQFKLVYIEPGCDFCGVAYCENGESDVEEGEIEFTDEEGALVYYDSELERYKYVETDEVIDDEDFYPIENNPFDN